MYSLVSIHFPKKQMNCQPQKIFFVQTNGNQLKIYYKINFNLSCANKSWNYKYHFKNFFLLQEFSSSQFKNKKPHNTTENDHFVFF